MLADLTAGPVVPDEIEEFDVQSEGLTAQGHIAAGLSRPFADRPDTDPSKRPVREIVGVDPALNQRWSSRRV